MGKCLKCPKKIFVHIVKMIFGHFRQFTIFNLWVRQLWFSTLQRKINSYDHTITYTTSIWAVLLIAVCRAHCYPQSEPQGGAVCCLGDGACAGTAVWPCSCWWERWCSHPLLPDLGERHLGWGWGGHKHNNYC